MNVVLKTRKREKEKAKMTMIKKKWNYGVKP